MKEIKHRRIVGEGSDKVCCNCKYCERRGEIGRGINRYCEIDGHMMSYCDIFDNLCEHWELGQ